MSLALKAAKSSMNKFAYIHRVAIVLSAAALLLVGIATVSCSKSTDKDTATQSADSDIPELLAVQLDLNGRWSFYGKDGKTYCQNAIHGQPSDVREGHFTHAAPYSDCADFNYPYTVYKFAEKPQALNGCVNLKSAGFMSHGLIPVTKKNERISVVDSTGKVKFRLDPVDGKEIMWCAPGFRDERLAICNSDNKRGYVDTEGKAVIAPAYDGAGPFVDGLAIVLTNTSDGTAFKTIDKSGKVVFAFGNDILPMENFFKDGYVIVGKKVNDQIVEKLRLVDKTGKTVFNFPDNAEDAWCADGKYLGYRCADSAFVCDFKGNKIIAEQHYSVAHIDGDRFLKWQTADGTIINDNGQMLVRLDQHPRYGIYKGFGTAAGIVGKISFLSSEGQTRHDATFARIGGMGAINVNTDYAPALTDPDSDHDFDD